MIFERKFSHKNVLLDVTPYGVSIDNMEWNSILTFLFLPL
jgi:hypothetical protein